MRYTRLPALLVALAFTVLIPATAEAKRPKPIALALGDSLSVGVQPTATGVNKNTGQGYASVLARSVGGVRLVNLGCGFATSESFIKGGRPCAPARKLSYKNKSSKTSQLATAEKVLRGFRGSVKYVTLDIGANDVASCAKGGSIDLACVNKGVAALKKNVPTIAKRLRKAAGRKVPIVGMTLYNPFLQSWFTSPPLAQASVGLAKTQVNDQLIKSFKAGNVRVADVATAFGTYKPFSQTTPYAGRTDIPTAVVNICKYTWMCAPKPRGPNIHANKAGYKLIAGKFRTALGKAGR